MGLVVPVCGTHLNDNNDNCFIFGSLEKRRSVDD